MAGTETFEEELFERLADHPEGDGGLTAYAAEREAGSFLRQAGANAATKTADGLLDPKLVLSWLVTNLGASSAIVGLLVPVREAGSLLPQLATAPRIHGMARRKWAWAAGSLVQGLACAGIAVAGLTLEGAAAGGAIVALLAMLAIARSVCSVSHKDVLGKTVGKARRGSATGLASSTASVGVIVFAILLIALRDDRETIVIGALVAAAALWVVGAAIFAGIDEERSPGDGGPTTTWGQLRLLREDPQLVRFIVVRGLLTATALAPPYLVLLGTRAGEGTFGGLGVLVLASAAASFGSSYVWGRLADRSSKTVLRLAGVSGAAALLLAIALDAVGVAGTWWAMPLALLVLMVSYHGVRTARSTYLVDMAPEDQRPQYTAVANTVIGVTLLGSGVAGAFASLAGTVATLALFSAMALAAAVVGAGLREVE